MGYETEVVEKTVIFNDCGLRIVDNTYIATSPHFVGNILVTDGNFGYYKREYTNRKTRSACIAGALKCVAAILLDQPS